MNLLLDTHVALWAFGAPDRLGSQCKEMLIDPRNAVAVSAVSVWEVEIKRALGKLESPDGFADLCRGRGFDALDVNYDHATTAGQLPPHHADPFDRILIAQAMIEGMVMLTQDAAFARYSVPCLDPAS